MKVKHLQNTPERIHHTLLKSENLRLKPKVLYAGVSRYETSWQEQAHHHAFLEVLYVKKGCGYAKIAQTVTPMAEGDILIYNPGVQHYEWTDGEGGFETIFFGVENIALEGMAQNQFPVAENPVHTGEEKDIFHTLFTALAEESGSKLLYSTVITEHYVTTILLKLLRLLTYGDASYFQINKSYLNAKKYIDEHYCQIVSMEALCKTLFVSQYHLNHLFQEYCGISPFQYIIEKKVAYAKQLLVTTPLSIQQIAAQSGYQEVGSFIKAFKRITGQTPTAYRKQHREM